MLSWNFPPTLGGIEYVAGHLFRGLEAAGHQVRVVTTQAGDAPADEHIFRAGRPGIRSYLQFAFRRGRILCRGWRPDILVCGSVVAAPVAFLLSKWYRVPYLVLVHGSDVLHTGWLYQRTVRFLFKRADRLTANSRHTRGLLSDAGVDPDRIAIVHPGVETGAYGTPPADLATHPLMQEFQDRRVLLSVGRLIRRKGLLEFVLDVMPDLVIRFPEVMLVIVGDDATRSLVHGERMRDQIEAAVTEKGLANHVRLLGTLPDPDVVRLFFRADLFVLPGLATPDDIEGFGIVFLEAALAHTAALATRVGGIPDAVADGKTGLLVEAGNHQAMKAALVRLLTDDALREGLAAEAARRARGEFAWPVITERYVTEFDICVSGV